jgi:two-component system, LytTR family, sensor kinase
MTATGQPATGEAAEAREPFRMGRRELLLVFGFWTFYAVLTAANRLTDGLYPGGTPRPFAEGGFWLLAAAIWAALTPLVFGLVWRFNVGRYPRVLRAILFFGCAVAIALLVTIASDVLWGDVFRFPRFGGGSASPLRFLLGPWFLNNLITFAGILAAGFARQYFLQLRARREEAIRLQAHAVELQAHAAQLQAQLAEARLAVLRTQLNPHFLFNTLNAVSALVARDPKGVRRMIARLSDLLRYALDGSQAQEIPLRDELKLLQRYLEILEIRYQGRLQTRVVAEPEVQDALVPNLILQPLAENAMKHAIELAGGYGRIEVHAHRSGDDLVLGVLDTGPGSDGDDGTQPARSSAGTGVGLRHTRARLEECYGTRQRLELRPAPEGGTLAEITLPFRTRPEASAAPEPPRAAHAHHG